MDSLGRQAVITTHTVLPGRHRLWEEKLSAGEEGRADNFQKKKTAPSTLYLSSPLAPMLLFFFLPWILISRFKFDRAIASLKFGISLGGLSLLIFFLLIKGVPLWFSLITFKNNYNKTLFLSLKFQINQYLSPLKTDPPYVCQSLCFSGLFMQFHLSVYIMVSLFIANWVLLCANEF